MNSFIIVAAALAAIMIFLLASASANTTLFARHYPLLLAVNGAVAVALFGVVLFQLRKLWGEYRNRVFGYRLKYRLIGMFAFMAIVPGVLIYAVSMQFAVRSIESWFDVRVDAALEGGVNLGRNAFDHLQSELVAKANVISLELAEAGATPKPALLNRLREQAGVASASLFGASGQVLASSSSEMGALVPDLPTPTQLRQARQGRQFSAIEGDVTSGLTVRVLVPVSGTALAAETRILQLLQPVPAPLASSAENVQAAYRDYQELSLARQGLRRIYSLTLTLTLLLALFAAIAVAFLLTRRLSAPLSILAEGTQAVAQGDYSPRQALPARDELGVLTQSFNRMTRQLDEARALAERSRAETEAARAYLESVLANLSAGVLAFDGDFRLRAANRGARTVLGEDLVDLRGLPIAEWPRRKDLTDAVTRGFADNSDQWQQQLETQAASGMTQVLLVRGSRLPEPTGGGYVVVFDDITQLIAAQRSAAWGEVARRLAHEIKNPLTPIQLSAERLQHKLAEKLGDADRIMLARSITTIVSQVEAMKSMVNDFRDYARVPPPVLTPLDLNQLVTEVLGLYESTRAHLTVELQPGLPPVAGDATQLRQVIHNLLQNAEDALGDTRQAEIRIETQRHGRGARLVVTDNGGGFPPQILARAFEPYVTTKARGTGLGLAIVKKIVDEHHGEVHIANREPHGAEVRVELPLAA
jgi:nitrogen fixation/metabolism regulation signal transduction histidine kinase